MSTHTIQDEVRETYAAAARAAAAGQTASCGTACCTPVSEVNPDVDSAGFYTEAERAELPEIVAQASLGCGNPLAIAELHEGETVLDLGSGAGGDVLLSARRVGPTGRVYGLDMTDEMLELARRTAAEAGAENVEFRKGQIEQIPLPDATVDVIISNCVINLSTDKPAVFDQMFRVLRAGGRVGLSDIVAEDGLTAQERVERGSWAGCVAGALSRSEYLAGLADAGFVDVEVSFTKPVTDGMHSAIVKAHKPAPGQAGPPSPTGPAPVGSGMS